VASKRVRRIIASALILGTAAILGACTTGPGPSPTSPAGAPSPVPTGTPSPTVAAVKLLLRVTSEGGFIGPAANLAAVPTISVYADGRIMSPGPVDTMYPGPLLPPVAIKDVGPGGVQAIVAAIKAAGLDKPSADGGGGNPDTGTTVFVVNLDGTPVTTRIGLGGGPGGPGIPGVGGGSPDPSRAAAQQLLDRLNDPGETWGSSPTTSTLVPTAYRVYVAPGAPAGDGTTTAPAIAWPLSTPLDAFGVPAVPDRGIAGLRQGAVFGADAVTLGPVLASASAISAFSSGGKLYTLYVRPLLPDEAPTQG